MDHNHRNSEEYISQSRLESQNSSRIPQHFHEDKSQEKTNDTEAEIDHSTETLEQGNTISSNESCLSFTSKNRKEDCGNGTYGGEKKRSPKSDKHATFTKRSTYMHEKHNIITNEKAFIDGEERSMDADDYHTSSHEDYEEEEEDQVDGDEDHKENEEEDDEESDGYPTGNIYATDRHKYPPRPHSGVMSPMLQNHKKLRSAGSSRSTLFVDQSTPKLASSDSMFRVDIPPEPILSTKRASRAKQTDDHSTQQHSIAHHHIGSVDQTFNSSIRGKKRKGNSDMGFSAPINPARKLSRVAGPQDTEISNIEPDGKDDTKNPNNGVDLGKGRNNRTSKSTSSDSGDIDPYSTSFSAERSHVGFDGKPEIATISPRSDTLYRSVDYSENNQVKTQPKVKSQGHPVNEERKLHSIKSTHSSERWNHETNAGDEDMGVDADTIANSSQQSTEFESYQSLPPHERLHSPRQSIQHGIQTQSPSSNHNGYELSNQNDQWTTYHQEMERNYYTQPHEHNLVKDQMDIGEQAELHSHGQTPDNQDSLEQPSNLLYQRLFVDELNTWPRQEHDGPHITRLDSGTDQSAPRIELIGDLNGMVRDWEVSEIKAARRLVRFKRSQDGTVIKLFCEPIREEDYNEKMCVISCIWNRNTHEYCFTSVDCIYLLEVVIDKQFPVEEKNRVRRNLEVCKPTTVSKTKVGYEQFFKQIMSYDNPRPRTIEKDVKVFSWKMLDTALRKIVSKYDMTETVVHEDYVVDNKESYQGSGSGKPQQPT